MSSSQHSDYSSSTDSGEFSAPTLVDEASMACDRQATLIGLSCSKQAPQPTERLPLPGGQRGTQMLHPMPSTHTPEEIIQAVPAPVQSVDVSEDEDLFLTRPVSMEQINQLEADHARMVAMNPDRAMALSGRGEATVMVEYAKDPNRQRHQLSCDEIQDHIHREEEGASCKPLIGSSHTYTKKTPRDESSPSDQGILYEEVQGQPMGATRMDGEGDDMTPSWCGSTQDAFQIKRRTLSQVDQVTVPAVITHKEDIRHLKPWVRMTLIVLGLLCSAAVVFSLIWFIH